ncbi:MAG: hypothetical protein HY708_08455 [Ignavibacteriae bacterium]|nr:hypothetical protein [Ignavibacteriota bacterium]
MTTGQTLLAVGAMMFLSTILLNFYRLLGSTGEDIAGGQDGILATTIATSYLEIAQGLAFDRVTDTSEIAISNPSALTSPAYLGPDGSSEDSLHKFNDFDDLDGFAIEKEAGGTGRKFTTQFSVCYVTPDNVEKVSTSHTFVKRMDLKTWRSYPPLTDPTRRDTLRISFVMGYFHFD